MQPKINAELGERVGSSLLASLVNFVAALVVITGVLAARPSTRRNVKAIRTWPVPRWTLTAGLAGTTVVLAGALAVETTGVAVFSVAFFAGQVACGLVADHFGIGPGGRRPIAPTRAYAAVLALTAVVVSQIGRPVGSFAPALVAFVVASGAAAGLQSAFNARITIAVGDAYAAGTVNVVVGTVLLGTIVATAAATGHVGTVDWPTEPWLYTGGVLGVSIVLALAVTTAALGVLRATLAMLAAQLVTAFAVDWLVQHEGPTTGVFAGAALIVVAVALVGRGTPTRVPKVGP